MFYDEIRFIDIMLQKTPAVLNVKEQARLKKLLEQDKYRRYFYTTLDGAEWFDYVNNYLNQFRDIPVLEYSEDGQNIRFYQWWPGKYLIRVAGRIPEKVLPILKTMETENRLAIDDGMKAILNMPEVFLVSKDVELVSLIDNWLNLQYRGFVYRYAVDLLEKYMQVNNFRGVFLLLAVLTKCNYDVNKKKLILRDGGLYFKELADKIIPRIIKQDPISILKIIENNLIGIIKSEEEKNGSADYSIAWRPVIENSSQNWNLDDPKDVFVEVVRDIIPKIIDQQPSVGRAIIERYLTSNLTILKRIAIFNLKHCKDKDLIDKVIMDQTNLNKSDGFHEYFILAKDNINGLLLEQKKQFLSWILAGPTKKGDDEYKKDWQNRRLFIIKDNIEKDKDLYEYKYLLNEFKDTLDKQEHPDLLTYHTSWVGPTSELTIEQMKEKPIDDFVVWIKNNLQPPFKAMGPSPEGVARLLTEVVKEIPQKYAEKAELFIDEQVFPAYLIGLIRGFEEAIKAKKNFPMESVLRFMESSIKYSDDPMFTSKHDEFDIGKYSWLRGAIADLIDTLVNNDEFIISKLEDVMNRTLKILIELIEFDKDEPNEKFEKEYGPKGNNVDYVTFCINANRGKAMHALIKHALRRARMRPEEEKKQEEGKGSYPPGHRMDLYKEYLSKRLIEELSSSVQSCYGQYLPHLFYLDQEWVIKEKDKGNILPNSKEKERNWDAQWQGYIGFNHFTNDIYKLLKADFRKAISRLKATSENSIFGQYNEKLAEHLMVAFWRNLELIYKDSDLVEQFFENAKEVVRGHAIGFLANGIDKVMPSKDSELWGRLKNLWEKRVEKAKDGELGTFVEWLNNCPEDLKDIIHLIKPIIPFIHLTYDEELLLEYLKKKINVNTKEALIVFNELLKIKESSETIGIRDELITEILTKARDSKDDKEIAEQINNAVNKLGEMGYYQYRELLIA